MPANKFELSQVLREELHRMINEIQSFASAANLRLEKRHFDKDNLPFCLEQMERTAQRARLFYRKHK